MSDNEAEIDNRIEILEEKVEQQQALIEKLQERVADLEERTNDTEENNNIASPTGSKKSAASTTKKKKRTARKRRPSTGGSKKRLPSSSSEKKLAADTIPEDRRAIYNVGKAKIPVILPEEYAGNEGSSKKPSAHLDLEFAYGYNGRNMHDNLKFWNSEDRIVYCLAGAGVVYDFPDNSQTFFTGHNEDILSFAMHPTGKVVATGQLDPKGSGTPFICIWDETGKLKHQITYHQRGICALAFSPDGKFLASVGNDDNHTLAIHHWEGKRDNDDPNISVSLSKEEITSIDFHPNPAENNDYAIIALGTKTLKIVTLTKDAIKGKTKGGEGVDIIAPPTFKTTNIIQKSFNGVAFDPDADPGLYWLATQTGAIYLMRHDILLSHWKGHSKFGGAIKNSDMGIVSVGDEGKLKVWTRDSEEPVKTISIAPRKVRSMDVSGNRVLCGTTANEICIVDLETEDIEVVMNGHYGEVWALAVHPEGQYVVTGGHDKKIMVWDTYEKSVSDEKTKKVFKANVRAACFSPDGQYLAVTTHGGRLVVIEWESWKSVFNEKIAKEQCDALTFSPTGKTIAVGSWDQNIYLFSIPRMKKSKVLKGHASSVIALQYSEDGSQLMSNSKDYEILYWDMKTGQQIKYMTEIADTTWRTWNCILGWAVQGIWEGAGDGTDVNSVDRSPDQQHCVVGDDFGKVRLYSYPTLAEDAPHRSCAGHSSHVTCVRFSNDGSRIFSTGGADMAVFQWSIRE